MGLTETLPNFQEEDAAEQQFSANFCPMSCRRIQTLTLQLWGHQWGLMEGDTPAKGATQATMATQPGILIHGRMMEATPAIRASTSTSFLRFTSKPHREQIMANLKVKSGN